MKNKYSTFNVADYLDDEEVIAEYLTAAADDENPDVLLSAIAEVAKSRGMSQVATAAGLGRESLYKALAPGAHPRYATITAVMRALKVKIAVAPIAPPTQKRRTVKVQAKRRSVARKEYA